VSVRPILPAVRFADDEEAIGLEVGKPTRRQRELRIAGVRFANLPERFDFFRKHHSRRREAADDDGH
jgi:hypothetical protein